MIKSIIVWIARKTIPEYMMTRQESINAIKNLQRVIHEERKNYSLVKEERDQLRNAIVKIVNHSKQTARECDIGIYF